MNNPKIIKTDVIYNHFGKKFVINTYQAEDGQTFDWASLDSPASSLIVTLTPENNLVMVRQYRFTLGIYVLEHPAGGSDQGESQLDTAKRELFEETGYQANEIILLGRNYILPSETNRWVNIYLAKNAIQIAEAPHDNIVEKYFDMSLEIVPLAEAESKITGLEHLFALQLVKKYL